MAQEKTKIVEGKIDQLIPDDKNMNRHNQYGMSLLEKSIGSLGLGRSILVDKNNKIIAGNGVTETAANLGMEDVIIVPSDGKKLVVVRRDDIDIDSKEGRELALADNAVGSVNLEWDEDAVQEVQEQWDIKPEDWGVRLSYDAGHEVNEMTDEDVDILEQFDPVGKSAGLQRVVFMFDDEESAERYLKNIGVQYKKMNMAWQVNLSTRSI